EGSYTVTLLVRDGNARTATFTQPLYIAPLPLTASITVSSSPSAGPSVGQLASFTVSVSGGTSPYLFTWDFGDGATASGNPVNHSFNMPGIFSVTVRVTDSNANTIVASQNVTVVPLPITANFTVSPEPSVGVQVTLVASASGGARSEERRVGKECRCWWW